MQIRTGKNKYSYLHKDFKVKHLCTWTKFHAKYQTFYIQEKKYGVIMLNAGKI